MITPQPSLFTASTTEALTLLILALLITALRTYARAKRVGFRNFQPDDYLVVIAATHNELHFRQPASNTSFA